MEKGKVSSSAFVCIDEATGVDSSVFQVWETWAGKTVVIGCSYPCDGFFKEASHESAEKGKV